MKFQQLAALYEAKGTKPGQRYHNVSNSEGPSGIAASPVGRSDNFELYKNDRKDPADKGNSDAASIIGILGKGLQLLKNDDVFTDQMKGIMNGFQKNRHQISAYQESILKSKPKTIDNLWGTINRLTKIVNDPKKQEEKDYGKWVDELQSVIQTKDDAQAELDAVYDEIDGVTEKNEELNNEYLEQLITVIRHTTKRLYNQLTQKIQEDPKLDKPLTMHDLDWDALQKKLASDSQAQLELLEMLTNADSSKNPLIAFLSLQEKKYDDARDRYFQLRRGDNYSITTDQLYRNLPLFTFVNFFAHTILKSPAIKLTTKQSKIAKDNQSGDDMITRLSHVKSEREFEELKPELLEYIKSAKLDKMQKDAINNIANGKFVARKGAPNAAVKIRSLLKTANVNESFDFIFNNRLKGTKFNNTDFKLNIMEVFNK